MAECVGATPKQDMPPPGGYKSIPYKRIPAQRLLSGYAVFAGYGLMTLLGIYLFKVTEKKIKKHEIELRSSKMAIYPMLLAERDRAYLKQLVRNREAEAELMKDVPGWEVGTYFGERIYKLLPEDALVEPIFQEYYAHSSDKAWNDRVDMKLWV